MHYPPCACFPAFWGAPPALRAACMRLTPGAAWRWQWDTEEVDEEFAKKLQAEVEKMDADKAAKSPAPDAGAAAEGTE